MKQTTYPVPITRVAACAVLIVTVLALAMLIPSVSSPAEREWATPLGAVPVGDLLALVVGGFLGGLIGKPGFHRWAAGLAAVVWALRLVALVVFVPTLSEAGADGLVSNHLLGLPLGVAAAWFSAVAGERFMTERERERAKRPARPRWR